MTDYLEHEIDKIFKLLVFINLHYWEFDQTEIRILTTALAVLPWGGGFCVKLQ